MLLDELVGFLPNLFLALLILGLGIWLGILAGRFTRAFADSANRITSYNVCYTKLLRRISKRSG